MNKDFLERYSSVVCFWDGACNLCHDWLESPGELSSYSSMGHNNPYLAHENKLMHTALIPSPQHWHSNKVTVSYYLLVSLCFPKTNRDNI